MYSGFYFILEIFPSPRERGRGKVIFLLVNIHYKSSGAEKNFASYSSGDKLSNIWMMGFTL